MASPRSFLTNVFTAVALTTGVVAPKLQAATAAGAGDSIPGWPCVPELPEVRAAATIPTASLGNQWLAARGLVDVTKAPFNVDATGKADATVALQQAIFFAREHQMVVFFPSGTYRVSDTLRCPHGNHDPAGGRRLRACR